MSIGLRSMLCALFFGGLSGIATEQEASDILRDRPLVLNEFFGVDVQYVPIEGTPKDKRAEGLWLLGLAAQGNKAAQNNLGLRYATGDGLSMNGSAALRWLKMSAAQDFAPAEFNLGIVLAKGLSVHPDENEAALWFRRSAEHGYAIAQATIAIFLLEGTPGFPKDKSEALSFLRKAAAQNIPLGQFLLGMTSLKNAAMPREKDEAIGWIQKAANQGFPIALLALAELFEKGDGVAQDYAEALKLVRTAAAQGSSLGQAGLADYYTRGIGVLKNDTEAFKYYLLAANQGFTGAYSEVGEAYALGNGVQKNETEAINWYRKLQNARAKELPRLFELRLDELGRRFATGDRVIKNGNEAVRWYLAAAEEGNNPRYYEKIAALYIAGDCVPRNYNEALKWYRLAAIRGSQVAQNEVGEMYARGAGLPKDEIEALAWFYVSAAGDRDMVSLRNRDSMEQRLGHETSLVAQQRSKQILEEIDAANQGSTSSTPNNLPTITSPATETPKASGSGAIVSSEGHVLTAAHVVAGASTVKIVTAQGLRNAKVLRIDEANDLAVLKLEAGTYLAMPVASSSKIRLGQAVATIGFPNVQIQGFSPKVTRGEISSLNGIGDDPRAWQISVPVQSGNSGGPLLDESGNLVGVVVSKLGMKAAAATGDLPQNVNYAVKSSYALALLEPYLGGDSQEPKQAKPKFEDMVAQAQQSVVLILVY